MGRCGRTAAAPAAIRRSSPAATWTSTPDLVGGVGPCSTPSGQVFGAPDLCNSGTSRRRSGRRRRSGDREVGVVGPEHRRRAAALGPRRSVRLDPREPRVHVAARLLPRRPRTRGADQPQRAELLRRRRAVAPAGRGQHGGQVLLRPRLLRRVVRRDLARQRRRDRRRRARAAGTPPRPPRRWTRSADLIGGDGSCNQARNGVELVFGDRTHVRFRNPAELELCPVARGATEVGQAISDLRPQDRRRPADDRARPTPNAVASGGWFTWPPGLPARRPAARAGLRRQRPCAAGELDDGHAHRPAARPARSRWRCRTRWRRVYASMRSRSRCATASPRPRTATSPGSRSRSTVCPPVTAATSPPSGRASAPGAPTHATCTANARADERAAEPNFTATLTATNADRDGATSAVELDSVKVDATFTRPALRAQAGCLVVPEGRGRLHAGPEPLPRSERARRGGGLHLGNGLRTPGPRRRGLPGPVAVPVRPRRGASARSPASACPPIRTSPRSACRTAIRTRTATSASRRS